MTSLTDRIREIRNTIEDQGDRWPNNKLSIEDIVRLTTSLMNIEEDVKDLEAFAGQLHLQHKSALNDPKVADISAWRNIRKSENQRIIK